MKDVKDVDKEFALVVVIPVEAGSEEEVKKTLDTCCTSGDY